MTSKSSESTPLPAVAKATAVTPSAVASPAEAVPQISGDSTQFKSLHQIMIKGVLINACWAMEIRGVGCIVRTFTREGGQIAEALTFVPGIRIIEDVPGEPKLCNANP